MVRAADAADRRGEPGRIQITAFLLNADDFSQGEVHAPFQSQTEAMEWLLQHGSDVEAATEALVAAPTGLSVSSAESLLGHGANPATADSHGRAPLVAGTCSNCRSFPYRDVLDDPTRSSRRAKQIRFVETVTEASADVSDSPIM